MDDIVEELDRWLADWDRFNEMHHVNPPERAVLQRARDDILALREDTEKKLSATLEFAVELARSNARAEALEEAAGAIEAHYRTYEWSTEVAYLVRQFSHE